MNKYPKNFKNTVCQLIGAGISNVALLELLHKEGAQITVRDRKPPSPATADLIKSMATETVYGDNYLDGIGNDSNYIFRSPGIRPDIPQLVSANEKGSILGSECELFFQRVPCKTIGITGSDGKTTTVTLTEQLLSASTQDQNRKIHVAGNIGIPLVSLLDKLTEYDIVVTELSSFQLMDPDVSPTVSAITNLTPNHLDYHRGMEEYISAKLNVIGETTKRVIIHPNRLPDNVIKQIRNKIHNVITCGFSNYNDIYCEQSQIFVHNIPFLMTKDIAIKGDHNTENYMTAIGVCGDTLTTDAVLKVAKNFKGVAHRMEFIAEKNGVRFYDSSIDSTPSRTAITLKCFQKPLTVICGGYDKNLTYEILADALSDYASNVIITGSSAEKIAESIHRLPTIPFRYHLADDFEEAIKKAAQVTPPSGSVVLSPACASFDHFKNYKERGDFFAKIVNNL